MQILTSSKLAIAITMPLTIAGWLFSSTSIAESSFSLNKLLSSTQTSPQYQKLMNQISTNMRSSKTNAERVQCIGTRLGATYNSLSDARVAPFDCRFPNKVTLRINAQNLVILPSGRTTPLKNAKNFNSMPRPVSFSYQVTTWQWIKTP